MRALSSLAAAVILVLAPGCVQQDVGERPVAQQTQGAEAPVGPRSESDSGIGPGRALSAQARAECESRGGTVQRRGMMNSEMCVTPYADGGKQCTDSSQCEGRCITSAGSMGSPSVAGTCQKDDRLFGCFSEVLNGKAAGGLCVD